MQAEEMVGLSAALSEEVNQILLHFGDTFERVKVAPGC